MISDFIKIEHVKLLHNVFILYKKKNRFNIFDSINFNNVHSHQLLRPRGYKKKPLNFPCLHIEYIYLSFLREIQVVLTVKPEVAC